jgi:hypothetical protein
MSKLYVGFDVQVDRVPVTLPSGDH